MKAMNLILAVALIAGCGRPDAQHVSDADTAECFCRAAYEVLASRKGSPEGVKKECCGQCGGTGRVRSGDGLAWVDCGCESGCECKKQKQTCPDGKCPVRK